MITIRTKNVEHDNIYLHTKFYEIWIVGDGARGPEMTIFANFRTWSLFLREQKEINDQYKNKSC